MKQTHVKPHMAQKIIQYEANPSKATQEIHLFFYNSINKDSTLKIV